MLHAPVVHQRITRAAVKANDFAVGVEHAQVGDTADIEYAYCVSGTGKYALVEYRNQGRTLTTRGNVAASKICHHCDASVLGQKRWIIQLRGVSDAIVGTRLMPHGLSVGANSPYLRSF